MARRRVQRLSGSPAHHKEKAREFEESARRNWQTAHENAEAKKCKAAFSVLIAAERAYKAAEEHGSEAKSFVEGRGFLSSNAVNSFKANCLVGGGLSGLSRRPSRRRARR